MGGLCVPDSAHSSYRFPAAKHFDVCEAVMLKDGMDSVAANARGTAKKPHVIWAAPLAHRHRGIPAGAEGMNKRLLDVVDEVARQCDVRQAFRATPHLPVAGTLIGNLHLDLLFSGAVVAFHAMGVYSQCSPSVRVRSKTPSEV